ncbi:MAG: di-trans,poly-cis-decaprenylcistransferase [Acidimicrobiia bacterium]|nr:di-trans,poly-cis-decaprenylcistransferase [Acidimicrobiia bacterium]
MSFAPPRHVGVIMDGNGRWAAKRGLPRVAGHAAGEKAVLDVLEGALEAGIEWFTLFLFSTENWRRSAEEVSFLMKFCDDLLSRRGQELVERGARLHVAGDLSDPRIPDSVRRRISETLSLTGHNTRLNLVIAFNYGSRREIADAARLGVSEMPDADLIFRTSGESRVYNFLLWQAAYAELYFTEVLWPDFNRTHLAEAIADYQRRERRFGRVRESR